MAFKVIKIPLTPEQAAKIRSTSDAYDKYALLAEPKMYSEVLNVQVLTEAQYMIIRKAILKAHKLEGHK